MTGFRLDSVPFIPLDDIESTLTISKTLNNGPVILRGNFSISGQPMDTYLNTDDWGKGVAFVNGRNLGRYWPLAGPQITLYVPASYLRTGENELLLVELEYIPMSKEMKLQNQPILDYTVQYSNSQDKSNDIRVLV